MEATVIQMDGQTRQAGNGALVDAIRDGMTEGRSRAEMREALERLERENAALRREAAEMRARLDREHRQLVNAHIELRVKCGALEEMRRGRAGQWSELIELSSARRQKINRFVTVVGALTALGAVAIICMAIITIAG